MKGQSKRRRLQAERRENRKAIVKLVLLVTLVPGAFIWMLFAFPRLGSPKDMVKSQIVPAKSRAQALPNSAGNSPSQTIPPARELPPGAATNRLPELVASNGREYLAVSFADLASFPFTVTPEIADATANPHLAGLRTSEQLPESVKSLDQRPVAITGFMLPIQMTGGLTSNLLLLRNRSACCYGIAPRISEWVIVHTKGQGVKPVMDTPVTALGTFHVGAVREEGQLLGLYQLDCDQFLTRH